MIKQSFRLLLIMIWVLAGTNTLAGQENVSTQTSLQIDTLVDTNEPAYQVCSISPNDCSLRGAISKANMSLDQEFILHISAGSYNLTLQGAEEDENATGDLDIHGQVTLAGDGASITQVDGNALDRVLHVHYSATVTLQDMTITDGLTPPEIGGGGIMNHGTLTILQSRVYQNATGPGIDGSPGMDGNDGGDGGEGGPGGGIYNSGNLVLQDSQVEFNVTGTGGLGGIGSAAGDGGNGGSGGAIHNINFLTLIQTTVSGNATGNGGPGGATSNSTAGSGGRGGIGGSGGGIYSTGTLKVYQSNIINNHTGNGSSGGLSLIHI